MTDAGVKFVKIPGAILYHPELKLAEKVFLGLVFSFDKGGLRLSNAELGKIVCLAADNVSRMIARLEAGGWVKITGKQSRWRRIYFDAGDKVNGVDTLTFEDSTLTLATAYFDAGDKQNRKQNKEKDFSFSADVDSKDFETTPAKAPPDPERVRRVLADLGFIGNEAAYG